MVSTKNFKYRGQASEILEPIIFSDYEIKSLKHGNTGHVLYKFPSKNHNWEDCWTSNLQEAQAGVTKYLQNLKNKKDKFK
tara:strand:- start:5067 stop:5306 length:240 start_codon:yes stop_codon:yes gene_type:complete